MAKKHKKQKSRKDTDKFMLTIAGDKNSALLLNEVVAQVAVLERKKLHDTQVIINLDGMKCSHNECLTSLQNLVTLDLLEITGNLGMNKRVVKLNRSKFLEKLHESQNKEQ